MTDAPTLRDRISQALMRPLDAAALAVFRMVFGALVLTSAVRFLAYGWVDQFFVKPTFFFHYWGLDWVRPLPGAWMKALFYVIALSAACISAGLYYRVAAIVFFAGFTYVGMIDLTNYINHYYFISTAALLLALMPLGRVYSIDAWLAKRRGAPAATPTLPAWCTHLLRFQVGAVYFFAGLAKAHSDWLVHAQPLNIWLSARAHLPVVGPLLAERWVAHAMSWAGFLFDISIVLFLSMKRTRLFAYAAVLVFHVVTRILFPPIGMFPFIMMAGALLFFPPSWPRDLAPRVFGREEPQNFDAKTQRRKDAKRVGWAALALGGGFCLMQVILPLRTHLYGGNVLWHEQGMRFSWRVMLREKNGSVSYRIEDPRSGRVTRESPRKYLDARQEREFAAQPDMIVELAQHIADDFESREGVRPKVRADVIVSLNGRPGERLVDPNVDLARVSRGPMPAAYILPAPVSDPIHLERRHARWAQR